ncbi:GvpL/GvpF family gas vesicle protein [Nocardioides sp. KR10-350]|uniref:GvpL/GvpF family gas vesicle protein n=1 Tax=Nocardioides cheoyonin TaxID=3156615 RepID=UPI0032B43310
MTETPQPGVFVYGVVAGDADLPADAVGPDGSGLRQVAYHDLAAVVGGVLPDWRPGRDDLLQYSRVVDALAAQGPVVPVQFGSLLADEQDVVDQVLAPEEVRLAALLEELAGKVQVQVRARYVEEAVLREVVGSDPEIQELRQRTKDLPEEFARGDRIRLGELASEAVTRRAEEDSERVLAVLRPHTLAEVQHQVGGMDVLDVAALVEADRFPALEQDLEDLAAAAYDRLRIKLVGPTAPYDFVGAE